MAILDFVKGGVREMTISRPQAAADFCIYRHPEQTIPWKAQLTVATDELAMFYKDGQFVGGLATGRHMLDGNNLPFLGQLVDKFTGGNVFVTDLYFVTTREYPSVKFGTSITDLLDPQTSMPVRLMVHGEFSAKVFDPRKFLTNLVAQRAATNDAFLGWLKSQVQKVIKDNLPDLMVKQNWPVKAVAAGDHTNEIQEFMILALHKQLEGSGVEVIRFGDFTVVMDPADRERLDKLAGRNAYISTAGKNAANLGAYQQMAQAEMMMGSPEAMKRGAAGVGPEGAGIGRGFAMSDQMANAMNQAQARAAVPPAAPVESREQIMATLKQLGELKAAGVLTDDEFNAKKKELLAKL